MPSANRTSFNQWNSMCSYEWGKEKECPSFTDTWNCAIYGLLFHIFWMRMVLLKPTPHVQLCLSTEDSLLDDHKLHHTSIHNHLTNAHYMMGNKEEKMWAPKIERITPRRYGSSVEEEYSYNLYMLKNITLKPVCGTREDVFLLLEKAVITERWELALINQIHQ